MHSMNTIENSLDKIAENILYMDEASLSSLWNKYKTKMEQFSFTPEWEKAVIVFSIINAVKVKNAIYNEQIINKQTPQTISHPGRSNGKPNLKLVK
ncbi:MAG: hypothetical protein A4E71_02371 [Smithella sp. PtaU1.Bin162]|nr:MAG: hypothetical protein A4E71_02371 [Smithella sp. PtaU1.Bin162]